MKTELKIDWCGYDAALYAVRRWHYSKSLPSAKTARLGVWENGKFTGAVIFAWGANNRAAGEYRLKMTQYAELSRVALDKHETPVSKIISISVKMLKRAMPGIRLLVSFADPEHGHIGSVCQAAGWIYVGESIGASSVMLNSRPTHRRTISSKYGTSSIEWLRKHVDASARAVWTKPKHKYLMPLDDEMKEKILPMKKPYPKRAASIDGDAPGDQLGETGSSPSAALQYKSTSRQGALIFP